MQPIWRPSISSAKMPTVNKEISKAEQKLCEQLLLHGEDAHHFLTALHGGCSSRSAIVVSPRAPLDYQPPFPCLDTAAMPWLPPKVFIPADEGLKLGNFDDYKAGYYYILDLSSCWESTALSCVPQPTRSLDLCAAPGGKTMLYYGRYQPTESHTANELVASRRGILRQNVELCGLPHVQITGLRPDQWAKSGEQFDLILADAPCSGQSLLAKGIKNTGCLGASAVKGNAKRQRGIMLAAYECLAPHGHILYTTCTYSPEENEKVVAYLLKRKPDLEAVEVPLLAPYRSQLCDFPAYRLLPIHGIGAGGFSCLIRRRD